MPDTNNASSGELVHSFLKLVSHDRRVENTDQHSMDYPMDYSMDYPINCPFTFRIKKTYMP